MLETIIISPFRSRIRVHHSTRQRTIEVSRQRFDWVVAAPTAILESSMLPQATNSPTLAGKSPSTLPPGKGRKGHLPSAGRLKNKRRDWQLTRIVFAHDVVVGSSLSGKQMAYQDHDHPYPSSSPTHHSIEERSTGTFDMRTAIEVVAFQTI